MSNGIFTFSPQVGDDRTERAFNIVAKALSTDDPVTAWLAAEDQTFEFTMAITKLVNDTHPQLLVIATEDLSGVAMVGDSSHPTRAPSEEAEEMVDRFSNPLRKKESAELFPRMDSFKEQYIKENSNMLHLHFIGVEVFGQGVGTRLLRHIQEMAAERGAGIWLEASSANSARLYARVGFKLWREFTLNDESPTLYMMVWHPQIVA